MLKQKKVLLCTHHSCMFAVTISITENDYMMKWLLCKFVTVAMSFLSTEVSGKVTSISFENKVS